MASALFRPLALRAGALRPMSSATASAVTAGGVVGTSQVMPPFALGGSNVWPTASASPPPAATPLAPLSAQQQGTALPPLNFDDGRSAFTSKSTGEIARALVVFHASAVPALVKNSRALLSLGERVLGKELVHYGLKQSFFGHFCAGEDEHDIAPTIEALRRAGIGAILDYAVEADVSSSSSAAAAAAASSHALTEAHTQVFLKCIQVVANQQKRGVAAMKLTGLAAPKLLERLSTIITREGPAAISTSMSPEDRDAIAHVESALRRVADSARDKQVRLLVDAEQTYFQPAIDYFVRKLQTEFNRGFPTIFNTYQCYLRDSKARVTADLEHANSAGYIFAGKLVRGAYMIQEAKVAAAQGRPNPIHPSIHATHSNYNDIMTSLIRSANREVMIASHNENSVSKAVSLMNELKLNPESSGIMFGQLLGMCDHVSYTLGRNGYSVYKYVPYGPVGEVIPYLIRRAEENSAVMVGASKERRLIREEFARRLSPFKRTLPN